MESGFSSSSPTTSAASTTSGEYDTENHLFLPESHGRMTWVDSMFFAPEALIDDRGSQIMWSWVRDGGLSFEDAIRAGWFGTYGIPRVLWLADEGTLGLAPAPELEALRYNASEWSDATLSSGGEQKLDGINGTSCELQMTVADSGSAQRAGVKVRCSPDGTEATSIYYDAQKQRLCCDTTASGSRGARVVEEAPLDLKPDEPLELQIFVDNSVVEVFANRRQAITRLVYPGASSDRIRLFSDGGSATFQGPRGWEMMPSNPH